MKTARILGAALAAALCGGALGEQGQPALDGSDVRIVSSFVAPGEIVPEDCREEARIFARSLVRYPRPASWHWVLVCDEAGWVRFLRLSGRPSHDEIYASTDLEARTTYLRGAKLLYPDDLRATADAIIAHELAHIELRSSDEAAAERLSREWQRTLHSEGSGSDLCANCGD